MADTQATSKIEELIQANPRRAKILALEWDKFLRFNAVTSPEIFLIEKEEDFLKWVSDHPEKRIDPSVWEGKKISDYYSHRKQQVGQSSQTKGEAVFPEETDKSQKTSGENVLVGPRGEERTEKSGPSVSPSDINRVIREISDAKKALVPEPPISPIPQEKQAVQRGLSSAGKAGPRVAAQAGRVAARAGKVIAQAALKNPYVLIALGIILLLFVIVFIIVGVVGKDKYSPQQAAVPGASLSATLTPAL